MFRGCIYTLNGEWDMKDISEVLYDTVKEYGASRALGSDMKNVGVFRSKCYDYISEKDNFSLLALRDSIYCVGDILEEDIDNETYKGIIFLDNLNMKSALFVGRIENGKIHVCAYAKEGIINQHVAKKAVEKLFRLSYQ